MAQFQARRGEGAPALPAEGMGWGGEEARAEHLPPLELGAHAQLEVLLLPPVCSRAESVLNCCIYDSSRARVGREWCC